MYLDNINKYLSIGSVFNEDEKAYRKNSFGPVILTIMAGIFPGATLKSYWGYMSVAMILVSLACILTVFKLSSYALTLRDSFWADAVIFGTWVVDLSILELMYLTLWKGFNPWMLLIFSPAILIPLFAVIKIRKVLKSEEYNPKKADKGNIVSVGFASGILGMHFAAIFRNVEQSTAFIVVLVCLSILNSFMSLGLLSLHKLYYMKKYKINL
jgi:hypothetical protein